MVSTEQIVAARAFLKWTQDDLARYAGVSIGTIKDLERGKSKNARSSTLDPIIKAFTDHGIEFIDDGVRRSKKITTIYEGQEGFIEFFDLVYHEIRKHGGEILVSNSNDEMFKGLLGDYYEIQVERMSKLSFQCRSLISENDSMRFKVDYSEYRTVPEKYFSNAPFYVFGNRLAVFIWKNQPKIILINDTDLADAYRKHFSFLWSQFE